MLSFIDGFFDTTTRAEESLPCCVAPASEGLCREDRIFLFRFTFSHKTGAWIVIWLMALPSAAMLAGPTVADVDEVVCFDHRKADVRCRMLDVSEGR